MATVEQTMMKVQRLLTVGMGYKVQLSGETLSVSFEDFSTSVQLRVKTWGNDSEGDPETLVLINSMILRGVKPSPALYEWVARTGGSQWFGHVEVYDDGDEPGAVSLWMAHTLLGDYLDEKELGHAMHCVLDAANKLDDELQQQFGGKRQIDD